MDAKRASDTHENGPQAKKVKTSGMSFAQRMMTKMGHVEGQGLGRGGEGMLNPIAVKLRPQGAGVGSVKEKTPQQKAAERRAVEQRGEVYEDSSEEERKERRRRKEANKERAARLGTPQPRTSARKARTVTEIETEGLQVPDIFKAFIDYTGAAPKQIKSVADLSLSGPHLVGAESIETQRLVKSARVELEAYANAWHGLQERKAYYGQQQKELHQQLENLETESNALETLENIADSQAFDMLEVGAVASTYPIEASELVAASAEPLVQPLDDWIPERKPPTEIYRLHGMWAALHHSSAQSGAATMNGADDGAYPPTSKELDAYESIFFTKWLPKVRTWVTNDWNHTLPEQMFALIEPWREVLPPFITDIIANQLAVPRLIQALKSWKPISSKHGDHSAKSMHRWIFPWFQYLDDYHLNPRSAEGLFAEVKRKFRAVFGSWDPNNGIVPDLDHWIQVDRLRSELQRELQLKMLPRLSMFLHDELEIDPSDQDRTPIDVVLQWAKYFNPDKFSRIFIDAFFPKWFAILHTWLTSDPNYDEVGQWYEWWHSIFPTNINSEPAIETMWNKGLEMMSRAMELGADDFKREIDQVSRDAVSKAQAKPAEKPIVPSHEEPATMRDILEDMCEEEGVLLLPLRKAHVETGQPLLRITASASGSGGAVVYISDGVVMAQNKRDRRLWDLVDIYKEGLLRDLAET